MSTSQNDLPSDVEMSVTQSVDLVNPLFSSEQRDFFGGASEQDILEAFGSFNPDSYQKMDYVYDQILNKISRVSQDRVTYFKLLSEFERYYLILAINDILVDMVLKDSGNKVSLSATVYKDSDGIDEKVENEEYTNDVRAFFEDFNLPDLVEIMLPDLLLYGEYAYALKSEEGKGVVSIDDPWVAGEVTALYRGANPIGYFRLPAVRALRKEQGAISSIMVNVKELPFNSVMHFQLGGRKIKLNLDDDARRVVHSPQMKVGMSFFWPAIEQMQLLKFREISEAARDLSTLTRPTLVGVAVPATESGAKSAQFCQKFEKLLNSGVQDPTLKLQGTDGLITGLSRVMAGRYKVLPQFQSGKGQANKLDLEDQIRDDSASKAKINDNRDLICTILGIPPEAVSNQPNDLKDNYKMYARLSKKVKAIQRDITKTLKILCVHHLSLLHSDENVDEANIEIQLSSSTSIEDIDDAEAMGYVVDNIKSLIDLATSIRDSGIMGEEVTDAEGNTKKPPNPISREKFLSYVMSEFKATGSKASTIFLDTDELSQLQADHEKANGLSNKEKELSDKEAALQAQLEELEAAKAELEQKQQEFESQPKPKPADESEPEQKEEGKDE